MSDLRTEFISRIISTQNTENARQTRAVAEQRHEMIAEAEALALRFVGAQPAVRRVVLFGSLVFPFRGRASRDIDLWVEGATNPAELERIAADSPFAVDITIDAPDRSAVAAQVEKYGKVLYEAQS